MTKESEIIYTGTHHWVKKAKHGFEVYKTGVTHSVRCAIIGYDGEFGRSKAIIECNRRDELEK